MFSDVMGSLLKLGEGLPSRAVPAPLVPLRACRPPTPAPRCAALPSTCMFCDRPAGARLARLTDLPPYRATL